MTGQGKFLFLGHFIVKKHQLRLKGTEKSGKGCGKLLVPMRRMGTRTRLRRSLKLTKSNQDVTHLTRVTMRRMGTRKQNDDLNENANKK